MFGVASSISNNDYTTYLPNSQEFFGDYIAVGNHLFSFNLPLVSLPGSLWKKEEFIRVTDGLVSVMLALRKRPVIRYGRKCDGDPLTVNTLGARLIS